MNLKITQLTQGTPASDALIPYVSDPTTTPVNMASTKTNLLAGVVPTTRTVNSKALSSNVVLTTNDVADSTNKRYVTDAELVIAGNTSGTNTGDVTLATNHGLGLTGQVLAMGTPSTLTAATTNAHSSNRDIKSSSKRRKQQQNQQTHDKN